MLLTRVIWLTGLAGLTGACLTLGTNVKGATANLATANEFTRPVLFQPLIPDLLAEQDSSLAKDPALDTKVSVSFHGASLDDVLKWLSSQGISFVADQTFPKPNARLTMRIENQALRDVLLAIADVFGGAWQKQGDIYVLKSRGDALKLDAPLSPKELGPFDLQDPKQAEEFAKRMREWSEKFAKEWKEFEMPDDAVLKDLLKRFQERFEGGEWKEFQGGKMFVFPPGEWKSIDPDEFLKDLPEIKARIEQFKSEDWPKEFRDRLPKFRFGGDLMKLFKSVTPEQWKLHEDRGYLTPNDLTDDQRAMLGFQGGGAVEINININGKSLIIKST